MAVRTLNELMTDLEWRLQKGPPVNRRNQQQVYVMIMGKPELYVVDQIVGGEGSSIIIGTVPLEEGLPEVRVPIPKRRGFLVMENGESRALEKASLRCEVCYGKLEGAEIRDGIHAACFHNGAA